MTISAKIIADSVSPDGVRITSLELKYPRFIHAEFMTHRVFSRNASSSRAIPVERMIQNILDDTAMPIHWGKNQPGMQAREECDEFIDLECLVEHDSILIDDVEDDEEPYYTTVYESKMLPHNRQEAWEYARDEAIEVARAFHKAGYHKQIVNRLLEPFSHITVLVTATEWDNFFSLRLHPDAQPEIHELARQMKTVMDESNPRIISYHDYHLPYVTEDDDHLPIDLKIQVSVARCARVSYLTHDGKVPVIEKDLELYEKLVGAQPIHASPAEHQATPAPYKTFPSGNFKGWQQYRQEIQ